MLKLFSLIGLLLIFTGKLLAFQGDTTAKRNTKFPAKDRVAKKKKAYGQNPIKSYNQAFFEVKRLNRGVGLPPNRINLETPQAALEHFMTRAENGDFEKAAYALNFNLYPENLSKKEAGKLAEKLFFVLKQRVSINWGNIPDRPDGQIDVTTSSNKAIAGKPRRSLIFGEIDLHGRDINLRLQRLKFGNQGAFWMIAANSVDNIEQLYAVYGPRELDRAMPDWARLRFWGMPIWKFAGTLILIVLCYQLGRFSTYVIKKGLDRSKHIHIRDISNKLGKPLGVGFGVLVFYILLNTLISFSGLTARIVYALLLITVIAAVTWFLMRLIDYIIGYITRNKIGNSAEERSDESKRLMTYVSVARRVITFLVVVIGASVVLGQFRSLERLGVSLLASAGLATVILGVAAQSTLGNIIAGIQIAITRPAKIGDTVIFNAEWGQVEDIHFTYMIVQTWDKRRLIIPLKEVITKTFENWSMNDTHQFKPVSVFVDYTIDIEKVRQKFIELVKNNANWDGEKEPALQVVAMREDNVELRGICSAEDPYTAWDLHCEIREQLLEYIRELAEGQYLSKSRVLLEQNENKSTRKE